MAIESAVKSLAELKIDASKFYQQYQGALKSIEQFLSDLNSLRVTVVGLENQRMALEVQCKQADLARAKVEEEARTRLAGIDSSNRALVDRLSRKEVEAAGSKREYDAKFATLDIARHEVELLRQEYERKLAGMTEVAAVAAANGKHR